MAADVLSVEFDQRRWRELEQAVLANSSVKEPWAALSWFCVSHAAWVVVRLRRQLGTRADDVSLARVLVEIEDAAASMTVEWHVEVVTRKLTMQLDPDVADVLREDARRFAGRLSHATGLLDPARVRRDREMLERAIAPVKSFTDKRVAHVSLVEITPLEEAQVQRATCVMTLIWRRYLRLLTGSAPATGLTDTSAWHRTFETAWMPRSTDNAGGALD